LQRGNAAGNLQPPGCGEFAKSIAGEFASLRIAVKGRLSDGLAVAERLLSSCRGCQTIVKRCQTVVGAGEFAASGLP